MKIAILLLAFILAGCGAEYKTQKNPTQDVPTETTAPASEETKAPPAASPRAPVGSAPKFKPSFESARSYPAPAPIPDPVYERREYQVQRLEKTKPWPNRTFEKRVDSLLEQLVHQAGLAFSAPRSANISDKIEAQLILSLNETSEQVAKRLSVEGEVVRADIKTSRVVVATLVAPEFEITKSGDQEQVLIDGKPAVWDWVLVPKSVGVHKIIVNVGAKVEVNGKEKTSHIDTFKHEMDIEITRMQLIQQFCKEYWQWLWSVLLAPLGLFLWKKWRRD